MRGRGSLKLLLAAGACFALASTASATILSNGGFDSNTFTLMGGGNKTPSGWVSASQWGRDDNWSYDGPNQDMVFNGSVPSSGGAAILQWVEDDNASTGAGTLTFDVDWTSGPLGVFVFGWDDDANAPVLDPSNFDFPHSDEFNPKDSVDLLDEPNEETTPDGGVYVDVTTGPNNYGITSGSGYQAVTLNVDFGSGHDNVGVFFYGGRNDALRLDNVELVPEPGTLGLLALGGLGALIRRRRA
jgi:hypothetical protein